VHIAGIDTSREMLGQAARRARRGSSPLATTLVQMDAERLAFPDAIFDKAVVLFALAGLADPLRGIQEIQRVCRAGATIVIASHFRSQRAILRAFDTLLSPIHGLLRYRSHLDLSRFVAASGLEVLHALPANFCGHSTVLVCRKRG